MECVKKKDVFYTFENNGSLSGRDFKKKQELKKREERERREKEEREKKMSEREVCFLVEARVLRNGFRDLGYDNWVG